MSNIKLSDDDAFVLAVQEFAKTKFSQGKSLWFYGKYMDVYLRNSDRWIAGTRIAALTVANVTVHTQSQGVYSDFLQMLETLTNVVYVEGVFQPEHYPIYLRRGYISTEQGPHDPILSFYKVLDPTVK